VNIPWTPIVRSLLQTPPLVRDMYTKSWSAFDRLVAIVPPGGSIGYAQLIHHPSKTLTTFSGSTINHSASGIYNLISLFQR